MKYEETELTTKAIRKHGIYNPCDEDYTKGYLVVFKLPGTGDEFALCYTRDLHVENFTLWRVVVNSSDIMLAGSFWTGDIIELINDDNFVTFTKI